MKVLEKFKNKKVFILYLLGVLLLSTSVSFAYFTSKTNTSGSGDVLSGILAGMLGYFDCNLLTISAGVLVNGIAGEAAAHNKTDISMIASDTISHIPDAIKRIRGE